MSRQANGQYLQPANTAAVSGQTISSTAFNTLITDIGTEITNSLDRGGRSAMTAALPMGGQKITGMADPTVSTDAATKNYADAAIASFFSTGDVKLTIKTAADTGWVLFDDGTIGSAGSGASSRANADTQALFTLLFNNIPDTYSPIFTSGGGATTRAAQTNAASAWAANCRISIPKTLGRAMAVSGAGAGLGSTYALGQTAGEFNHTLTLAEIPTGINSANASPIAVTVVSSDNNILAGAVAGVAAGAGGNGISGAFGFRTSTGTLTPGVAAVTSNNTGGTSHNNTQPTVFLNAMIKL